MPQGLQCWDVNGKLVVDIGDYNLRYVNTISITYPANSGSATFNYSGMTKDGFICVCKWALGGAEVFYTAVPYNGGFRVMAVNTNFSAQMLTVEVYAYI